MIYLIYYISYFLLYGIGLILYLKSDISYDFELNNKFQKIIGVISLPILIPLAYIYVPLLVLGIFIFTVAVHICIGIIIIFNSNFNIFWILFMILTFIIPVLVGKNIGDYNWCMDVGIFSKSIFTNFRKNLTLMLTLIFNLMLLLLPLFPIDLDLNNLIL
jgi:hypothetical protein